MNDEFRALDINLDEPLRDDEKLFVPKPYAQNSISETNIFQNLPNSYQSSPKRQQNSNECSDYLNNGLTTIEIKKKCKKKVENIEKTVTKNVKK